MQYYNEGVKFARLGQYSEALISFDKVIAINPDDTVTWYNRGIILNNLAMYTEAVASYDKALAINPYDTGAWRNRGVALENLALFPEAFDSYCKAIASYYKVIIPDRMNTSVKQNPEPALNKQTKSTPLLYAPVSAIVLMAGVLVWSRRRASLK